MHIEHVEVGNFRKLLAARIDLAEKSTVFVGANNSGKTSAMIALRRFLVDPTNFSTHDFTLTHWPKLDALGLAWEQEVEGDAADEFNWGSVLPHIDVWLSVPEHQLHFVQKILPTLDWDGSPIGVRLRYEPKSVEDLKREYLAVRLAAAEVMNAAKPAAEGAKADAKAFTLWPKSMMEFLAKRLRATFVVQHYLLDPAQLKPLKDGEAVPQALPEGSEPIDGDPFKGLIRIDEISAQRGLGAAVSQGRNNDDDGEPTNRGGGNRLSGQLRSYYTQHLDPFDQPEQKDLEALQALHAAQCAFDDRLGTSFAAALKELEDIGYPGVTDPKLTIATDIKPVDGLRHGSAVQYEVPTHLAEIGYTHRLPEETNGLGYQNLVSMVFALMSFRDKWMRVGKVGKKPALEDEKVIAPLHLVLIEEPEAHLHAQVQQVFITHAYDVLRNHEKLKGSEELRTQLVVSTHSSHLAHEAEFTSLRYFRRMPVKAVAGSVPVSLVVNLSQVFGKEDDTSRFVKRYLKVTHCDLFFADGAILVEGPAERIVVPHLVRQRDDYEYLRRCYITWLEIGGSHAHRLKSLLTHLGLNTLIITDLDAKDAANKAVVPARDAGQKARNETLKTWVPKAEALDELLDTPATQLVLTDPSGYGVRVAFQQPVQIIFKSEKSVEALANTFEDALLYENIDLFKAMAGSGLLASFRSAIDKSKDMQELAEAVKTALERGGKAEFAMDLLYSDQINDLRVPDYIHKGLLWLLGQLKRKEDDVAGKAPLAVAQAAAEPPEVLAAAGAPA